MTQYIMRPGLQLVHLFSEVILTCHNFLIAFFISAFLRPDAVPDMKKKLINVCQMKQSRYH